MKHLGSRNLITHAASAGESPDMPAAATNLPNLLPSPAFYFMVHPTSWDVFEHSDGTRRLLPLLRPLRFAPGVDGVSAQGSPHQAIAAKERRGWIVIRWEHIGEVEAFGEVLPCFCRKYNGRRGAAHYDAWSRPVTVGNQVYMKRDGDGYFRFLERVVDLLGDVSPEVLAAVEAKFGQRLNRNEQKADHNPAAARRAAKTEKSLEAVRAKHGAPVELDAGESPAAPVDLEPVPVESPRPTRKRARKRVEAAVDAG